MLNINEPQNNYTEWKKLDKKQYILVINISIKFKLIYTDKIQLDCCLRNVGVMGKSKR